jgi:hypothetical protein
MIVFYFHTFVNDELVERTFTDYSKCKKEAVENGLSKVRDNKGNEYYF